MQLEQRPGYIVAENYIAYMYIVSERPKEFVQRPSGASTVYASEFTRLQCV